MSPNRIAAVFVMSMMIVLLMLMTWLIARSDVPSAVAESLKKPPQEDTSGEIAELKREIRELRHDLHRHVQELTSAIGVVSADLQKDHEHFENRLNRMHEQVAGLQGNYDKFKQTAYDAIDVLRDTVAQISREGNKDHFNPSILSNMSTDSHFRREMDKAVHKTLHHHGHIIVRNSHWHAHTMRINNRENHTIPAQDEVRIRVPLGTVVTELVGFPEGPRNWTIAPPKYEQSLVIR